MTLRVSACFITAQSTAPHPLLALAVSLAKQNTDNDWWFFPEHVLNWQWNVGLVPFLIGVLLLLCTFGRRKCLFCHEVHGIEFYNILGQTYFDYFHSVQSNIPLTALKGWTAVKYKDYAIWLYIHTYFHKYIWQGPWN